MQILYLDKTDKLLCAGSKLVQAAETGKSLKKPARPATEKAIRIPTYRKIKKTNDYKNSSFVIAEMKGAINHPHRQSVSVASLGISVLLKLKQAKRPRPIIF